MCITREQTFRFECAFHGSQVCVVFQTWQTLGRNIRKVTQSYSIPVSLKNYKRWQKQTNKIHIFQHANRLGRSGCNNPTPLFCHYLFLFCVFCFIISVFCFSLRSFCCRCFFGLSLVFCFVVMDVLMFCSLSPYVLLFSPLCCFCYCFLLQRGVGALH